MMGGRESPGAATTRANKRRQCTLEQMQLRHICKLQANSDSRGAKNLPQGKYQGGCCEEPCQ
eukprot:CAMPEP_0204583792 /NCGR_PEP_ID=MMETSP0661-20131031/45979_1 /ASSEMBLY_ACC=CAM_ASM_000606 /TAXON_ID=109239 /ORGANISM="Alexandrium margalefi, Strain AMGDE01CS-322" /LENGTH=61 /DNA_ID=CAMNT_0051593183 /DNA_START=104 /DNA_END=286 /DNA_ORIENTATION=+